MKKFDLLSAIVNGALSLILGLAVSGCVISAFRLEAAPGNALLACLIWAAISCAALQFRRGWITVPIALALWGLFLWHRDADAEFGYLLRTFFTYYSYAYGIQIPRELLAYTGPDVTFAMEAIAGTVTLLAGICLTRLRAGALAVTLAVLPVLPCLVVIDTVPHEAFLFLLLVCMGLIILSQNLRRQDPRQASRLTAILLLPVVIGGIWLFGANPRQDYDKQPQNALIDHLAQWLAPFVEPNAPDVTIQSGISLGDVDLRTVGPKKESTELAMEVETSLQGVLYLRGKSYSDYDGLFWDAAALDDDFLGITVPSFLQAFPFNGTGHYLRIRIEHSPGYLYAAYYPSGSGDLRGGTFYNPSFEKEYSMDVDPLREDWQRMYLNLNPNMTLAYMKQNKKLPQDFTELPQATLTRAKEILQENGITKDMHVLEVAITIASLVRNSATYSLNTAYMPAGETDFALWFLEDSNTGYCVHFATAAAVLLRAAGIPARYVEGYVTRINSDGTARVTEDQAHAWVEYYLPDMGWVTLEATPSVGWEPPVETDKPTQPVTRPTTPSRPAPSTTEPSVSLQLPTANEPPTQPTHPSMTPGTDTPSKPGWLDAVVQGLLITVLALGSIIGQWQLRLYLRSRWLSHGSTNIQALRRWRWARRLAKLRRQDAPAALKELAQKAKFSQHTISREELAAFDGYFARSMAHLKSRNLFLRLAYRLIFAAY